jgi:hypothetical protein
MQKRIEKLLTTKPHAAQRTWRKPQWLKPVCYAYCFK